MAKPSDSKRPCEDGDKRNSSASIKKPRFENNSKKAGQKAPDQQQHHRQRRHADVVEQAKELWNKLRLKTNNKDTNRKLMDQLFPLIKGKAHEIALQHDASRVVQAALQFGTKEERLQIATELCNANLLELSESQYAHFVVLKLIKYCHSDAACVKLLTKALGGHAPRMAVHAVAAKVLEAIWMNFKTKDVAKFKQELYGPHYSLLGTNVQQQQQSESNQQQSSLPTLQSNFAVTPEKRPQCLAFVRALIDKGLEKNLYGLLFFQQLFSEYLDELLRDHDTAEIRRLAGTTADSVLHLLSTRVGTKAAVRLVSYATAKDRKRMLKAFKNHVVDTLQHNDAYVALIRLLQVTDDTVSVQKLILNELLAKNDDKTKDDTVAAAPLLDIVVSRTGHKFLVYLLVKDSDMWDKSLDPWEKELIGSSVPVPTIREQGEEVPTSKKDDMVRRRELRKPIQEPLLNLLCNSEQMANVLRSRPGGNVLKHFYRTTLQEEERKRIVDAVVQVCADEVEESQNSKGENDDGEGEGGSAPMHLLEDATGHLSVKQLILVDSDAKDNNGPAISSALVERLQEKLNEVASSNRGAFVVAALLQSSKREQVVKLMNKKDLQGRLKSKMKGPKTGYEVLLSELKGKSK